MKTTLDEVRLMIFLAGLQGAKIDVLVLLNCLEKAREFNYVYFKKDVVSDVFKVSSDLMQLKSNVAKFLDNLVAWEKTKPSTKF